MDQSSFKESFKVATEQLVDAVKKLLHEGNVRRIVIDTNGSSGWWGNLNSLRWKAVTLP